MSAYDKLLAQEKLDDPTQKVVLTANLSLFQVYRVPQGIHICSFVLAFQWHFLQDLFTSGCF